MRSVRSEKSLKSVTSLKSLRTGRGYVLEPKVNFEKELVAACLKFQCPDVVVRKKRINDEFYKNLKAMDQRNRRLSLAVPYTLNPQKKDSIEFSDSVRSATTASTDTGVQPLIVQSLYDSQGELAEIMFHKFKKIPRVLLQCITILIPYYKYIRKFSILTCTMNGYTIYELKKMISVSALTDICLDGSFLPEANYALLLNDKSRLRYLSLSRCRINDEICRLLSAEICFLAPAEGNLELLNLSSNHITDVGAKHLAEALRTNRHLRYLNLADNHITDLGAELLFHTLIEFPLTYDEIMQKRIRYYEYLKTKRTFYMRCLEDLEVKSAEDIGGSRKSVSSRKKGSAGINKKSKKDSSENSAYIKADMMVRELIGPFNDPFSSNSLTVRDGYLYCVGNFTLCYLNLAYNSLSFVSLKKLETVLTYQNSYVNKKPKDGLVKVLLEGNPIPVGSESENINLFFGKKIGRPIGLEARRRGSKK